MYKKGLFSTSSMNRHFPNCYNLGRVQRLDFSVGTGLLIFCYFGHIYAAILFGTYSMHIAIAYANIQLILF